MKSDLEHRKTELRSEVIRLRKLLRIVSRDADVLRIKADALLDQLEDKKRERSSVVDALHAAKNELDDLRRLPPS